MIHDAHMPFTEYIAFAVIQVEIDCSLGPLFLSDGRARVSVNSKGIRLRLLPAPGYE